MRYISVGGGKKEKKKRPKQNTDTNRTDDSWFPFNHSGARRPQRADRSIPMSPHICRPPPLTLCISPRADEAVRRKPAGTAANEGLSRNLKACRATSVGACVVCKYRDVWPSIPFVLNAGFVDMFMKNYRLLKEEQSHLDIQQRKTALDHFLSIQSSVLSELILK